MSLLGGVHFVTSQVVSCLAGVLVLMVDEAMELSRDEKRVRGGRKAGRRREELLSLHAGASPSRLGDHIFRPLLP